MSEVTLENSEDLIKDDGLLFENFEDGVVDSSMVDIKDHDSAVATFDDLFWKQVLKIGEHPL